MSEPLKICYAASEIRPFVKTGGLADVSADLPRALHRRGHDLRVFMPLYSQIDTTAHELHPVDFAQNVPVEFGGRSYRFSLRTLSGPPSALATYLVDCPELFHRDSIYTSDRDEPHRFLLFSRAVLESCQRMGWSPNLFHCNDWHTGLIPLLLRTVYDWDRLFHGSRTLFTIHNLGYQGLFPDSVIPQLGLGDWTRLFDQRELEAGHMSFLRTALIYADGLSTVSPTYAREIQTPEHGMGLDDLLRARRSSLVGILNGVDYSDWSPERDALIPHRFSRKRLDGKRKNKLHLLREAGLSEAPDAPLIGIVSRLAPQKGFDLCFEVLPRLLARSDLRLSVLGSGESEYERFFQELRNAFPDRVAYYRGYSERLAHLIEAGSDMFLMPSRYEPCGLNQMYSLRYGTIPIVRATGGLADTVRLFNPRTGEGTGIVFEHFRPDALERAMRHALALYRQPELWKRMVQNAMQCDYSWSHQAELYVEIYNRLTRR